MKNVDIVDKIDKIKVESQDQKRAKLPKSIAKLTIMLTKLTN